MEKFTIKRKVVIEQEVSYNKYIAIQIEQLRKDKKLTQEQLANNIGLTRVSIVNIESGRQQLSMKNLYLICKALNIKSTQLLPF